MGILETLTIIFVILKVLGIGTVATWSWFQVLFPVIIALALYVIAFIIWLYIIFTQ